MMGWIIDHLDADMDIVNNRSWTALHLAYEHDNHRALTVLEGRGADDTIRDGIGFVAHDLPMRQAALENEAELVEERKVRSFVRSFVRSIVGWLVGWLVDRSVACMHACMHALSLTWQKPRMFVNYLYHNPNGRDVKHS